MYGFLVDHPQQVAIRFGKIYSLDAQAVDVLAAVVRESMLANNVNISEKTTVFGDSLPSSARDMHSRYTTKLCINYK